MFLSERVCLIFAQYLDQDDCELSRFLYFSYTNVRVQVCDRSANFDDFEQHSTFESCSSTFAL